MGSSSKSLGSERGGDHFTAAMEFLCRFSGGSRRSRAVPLVDSSTTRVRGAEERGEKFTNFPPNVSTLDRDERPRFTFKEVGTSDEGLKVVKGTSRLEPITEVEEEEEVADHVRS